MTLDPDSLGGGKRGCSGVNSGVHTPRRIATPPPPADRARLEVKHNVDHGNSKPAASIARDGEITRGALDVDAVDDQLRRAISRSQRESTPGGSPSRKRQRINGDRCATLFLQCRLVLAT